MDEEYLYEIMYLSKKIGVNKKRVLSTTTIAKELGFSQQTASRRLIELEKKGIIKKELSLNGQKIELTKKAVDILTANYLHLKNIFMEKKKSFSGAITSGIGEGKYYVQIKKYNEAFEKLLGEKPFPGTLNIAVNTIDFRDFLSNKELVRVEGFSTGTRTFGSIDCYKINIHNKNDNNKIDGAIIIPERTNHPENIVEIIAPVYLRGRFKLRDNDRIEIT